MREGATSGRSPALRNDDQAIPRIALLDEIANEAHAEDRRCYFFDDADADEQTRLEPSRLRSAIKRLGWMADQAGALLGNDPVRCGQVEQWLFAPVNAQCFGGQSETLSGTK